MPDLAYVCPRCHHRLILPDQTALPPECPACGLQATSYELTQQRTTASRAGRRALTLNALSWLIGLLLVVLLVAAFLRFAVR